MPGAGVRDLGRLRRRGRGRHQQHAGLEIGSAGKKVQRHNAFDPVTGMEPERHLARQLFDPAKDVHHRRGPPGGEDLDHPLLRALTRGIEDDILLDLGRLGQQPPQMAAVDRLRQQRNLAPGQEMVAVRLGGVDRSRGGIHADHALVGAGEVQAKESIAAVKIEEHTAGIGRQQFAYHPNQLWHDGEIDLRKAGRFIMKSVAFDLDVERLRPEELFEMERGIGTPTLEIIIGA